MPRAPKASTTPKSPRTKKAALAPEKKLRTQPARKCEKKEIVRYDPGSPDILAKEEKPSEKRGRTRAPTTTSKKNKVALKNKPYISVIKQAIRSNEAHACHHNFGKTYVSSMLIENWIKTNYNVSIVFPSAFKQALKNGVASKKLHQVKNSFAINKTSKKKKTSRSSSRSRSSSPRPRKSTEKKPIKPRESRSQSPAKSSRKKSKESSTSSVRITKKKLPKTSNSTSETSPAPKLKRGESVVAIPSAKYAHFWQYNDGGWKNYDIKASDAVEKVYLDYLKNRGNNDVRAVKSGQWEYQVDFLAMKQTNINHENHTTRNIRRIPNTAAVSGDDMEEE